MSQSVQDGRDQFPVDEIWKSLTSRPNVQSSLILSRKDGSIIKAVGFGAKAASGSDYLKPPDKTSMEERTQDVESNQAHQGDTEESLSDLERLAHSIQLFVNAATGLAGHIPQGESGTERPSSSTAQTAKSGKTQRTISNTASTDDEQELQLLRMRTRQQEIIIFPDKQYLCCVVQKIGRTGNSTESR